MVATICCSSATFPEVMWMAIITFIDHNKHFGPRTQEVTLLIKETRFNVLGKGMYFSCLAQWRSQVTDMTPGYCMRLFFVVKGGWGHAFLVNFGILEAATQIVLETNFEMLPVLNRKYF